MMQVEIIIFNFYLVFMLSKSNYDLLKVIALIELFSQRLLYNVFVAY